jgi:hypothetical protein
VSDKHIIYGFVNGGGSYGVLVEALSDEGLFLAQHACSSEGFGPHDIGATSDWKHEHYRRAYPDGYEVVWVPRSESRNNGHAGLNAAYAAHLAYDPDKYSARMAEIFPAEERVTAP